MEDAIQITSSEIELLDEQPVAAEIVPVQATQVTMPVLTGTEVAEQAERIRDIIRSGLRDGIDYGMIPGAGTRKVLLKPGAEWLLKGFNFYHRFADIPIIEYDNDGKKWGVTYRCEITRVTPNGTLLVIATCDGYCSYDEGKYLSKKSDGSTKYQAPWNTLIKMAQKRALVGATLQATGTSGLFTQDIEDHTVTEPVVAALPLDATPLLDLLTEDQKNMARDLWKENRWPRPHALRGFQALEIAFYLGQLYATDNPKYVTIDTTRFVAGKDDASVH